MLNFLNENHKYRIQSLHWGSFDLILTNYSDQSGHELPEAVIRLNLAFKIIMVIHIVGYITRNATTVHYALYTGARNRRSWGHRAKRKVSCPHFFRHDNIASSPSTSPHTLSLSITSSLIYHTKHAMLNKQENFEISPL